MIPLKLTLQGLYSYQNRQTIDFTKLTAAHLFGIFGSVGSGKSSVLEAITFALYGKTDRLNLSGDNRNYNMMNLKSNDLLIDFEFETGKTQVGYRSVVKGRRNRKRFEDVKSFERLVYKKEDAEWIPIDPEILEKEIGLSYENFKRTIIIPQGQFQEFLQLKDKDRTQMMKELFNLEKFELYYKVASLEAKNNEQIQNVQGQLKQLGEVNPEQLSTLEEQLLHQKTELVEWNKKLETSQKQELKWQQIKILTEKFIVAKNTFENFQKQLPEFTELGKNIQQYEVCVSQFKNLFDSEEKSSRRMEEKGRQIKNDSEQLRIQESEIIKKEAVLKELQPEYEKRENLKQKADELEKLLKIKNGQEKIIVEKKRLVNGTQFLKETSEKVEQLKLQREKQSAELKAKKLKLPDLSLLSKVKTWFVEKESFDKKNIENKEEIEKHEKEKKSLNDKLQQIFIQTVFNELQEKKSVLNAVKFLQEKTEITKTKIKVLDKDADRLMVRAELEKFAANLKDEEPCPLCGSKHHPEIYSAENVHEDRLLVQNQKHLLEKELDKYNEMISALKEMDTKIQNNTESLRFWNTKFEENGKKISEHIYSSSWPDFKSRMDVEKVFEGSELLQKEIILIESKIEEHEILLDKELKKKELFQTEIDKIRNELIVVETETKTLTAQLKMISENDYSSKSANEIEFERQALLQKFSVLERDFNELSNQLVGVRKTRDTLSGSLKTNKLELESEQKINAELLLSIEKGLNNSVFKTIQEVKEILNQTIDLEIQKKQLADFLQNLAMAKGRFEELQKEIGDQIYDAEIHQKYLSEIENCKELITKINQELGKLTELKKKLLENLKNQQALRASLEKLELRAENIKTLKSLFKASGFVNYISSVYLQNLCNTANDRFFQLTRQKLSLEITEDNNFQVRDFMNGGKTRNVKTLSGGQTFQAALSLALALADNIQKITESNQNFFFLDEGFGSLDKESLSVVFDTLKSLRNENRIVGVISHVEEMQQEIDVHLRIENSEDSGSIIYESWAG